MNQRTVRPKSELAAPLHQRLNSYTLAATAASVSVLAVTPASEARIVFTPAHTKIPLPTRFRSVKIAIDLNHDGIGDFVLSNFFGGSAPNSYAFLAAKPEKAGNRVSGKGLASALPAGARVKFNNSFSTQVLAGWRTLQGDSTTFAGQWANGGQGVKDRYLGLRFIIKGQIHFGWARLSVGFKNGRFCGILTGYAYETIPNKAIVTGRTSASDVAEPLSNAPTMPFSQSLSLLATGVYGLAIRRRKENLGGVIAETLATGGKHE